MCWGAKPRRRPELAGGGGCPTTFSRGASQSWDKLSLLADCRTHRFHTPYIMEKGRVGEAGRCDDDPRNGTEQRAGDTMACRSGSHAARQSAGLGPGAPRWPATARRPDSRSTNAQSEAAMQPREFRRLQPFFGNLQQPDAGGDEPPGISPRLPRRSDDVRHRAGADGGRHRRAGPDRHRAGRAARPHLLQPDDQDLPRLRRFLRHGRHDRAHRRLSSGMPRRGWRSASRSSICSARSAAASLRSPSG